MILFLLAAAATVAMDLFSKRLALHSLASDGAPGAPAWFSFQLVQNRRGALIDASPRQAIVLWLASTLLLAAAVMWSGALSPLSEVGLGLALGGATGNLVERLVRGSVTDFLFIRHWPVFNLADTAMVCGFLLVLGGLR